MVSDRLENGKSLVYGGSECDFCKHKLAPLELIPVLSFLRQGGKCSSCNKKLTLYYPLSELLTGFAFAGLGKWLMLGTSFDYKVWIVFFFYLVITSLMIIILLSDFKFQIVPDEVVWPAIWLTLASHVVFAVFYVFDLYTKTASTELGKYLLKTDYLKYHFILVLQNIGMSVLTAFGIAAFFALLIFITKGRGMGGGDVKLGFLIGLFNGFPNAVIAIFIGFLTGALYSVILVMVNKKGLKDTIAFGPFLILGSFTALLFGNAILEWYVHLL